MTDHAPMLDRLRDLKKNEGSHPNQKAVLREAAVKLLCAVLELDHQEGDDEEVMACKKACREMRCQKDGHFLSMVSSLVLAILTGLLSLQLPSRASRIVGYLETKKGPSHKTVLDIEQERRNDVLGQKKLLVGCGGGFQQEAQQRYSPVRVWISSVHLTLLDEVMTLARARKWSRIMV